MGGDLGIELTPAIQEKGRRQLADALAAGDASKFDGELRLENTSELFALELNKNGKRKLNFSDSKQGLRVTRQENGSLVFWSERSDKIINENAIAMQPITKKAVEKQLKADGKKLKKDLKNNKDATGLLKEFSAFDGKPNKLSDFEAGILYFLSTVEPRGTAGPNKDLIAKVETDPKAASWLMHRASSNAVATQDKIKYLFDNAPLIVAYGKLVFNHLADDTDLSTLRNLSNGGY